MSVFTCDLNHINLSPLRTTLEHCVVKTLIKHLGYPFWASLSFPVFWVYPFPLWTFICSLHSLVQTQLLSAVICVVKYSRVSIRVEKNLWKWRNSTHGWNGDNYFCRSLLRFSRRYYLSLHFLFRKYSLSREVNFL